MKNIFYTCCLSKRSGFTLTEVMTVAVILGILAALAIGNFRMAIEKSKFTEGLQAAETIAGAIDRYYYEHPEIAGEARIHPRMDELDIEMSKWKPCKGDSDGTRRPYCRKIKNFEVQVNGQDRNILRLDDSAFPVEIKAYRGTAPESASTVGNSKYVIVVIPSSARDYCQASEENKCHWNTASSRNVILKGGYCETSAVSPAGELAGRTEAFKELCQSMGYTQQCFAAKTRWCKPEI